MFLRSFVANEMKYQLDLSADLSVSVQDVPHKPILIRIILKPK